MSSVPTNKSPPPLVPLLWSPPPMRRSTNSAVLKKVPDKQSVLRIHLSESLWYCTQFVSYKQLDAAKYYPLLVFKNLRSLQYIDISYSAATDNEKRRLKETSKLNLASSATYHYLHDADGLYAFYLNVRCDQILVYEDMRKADLQAVLQIDNLEARDCGESYDVENKGEDLLYVDALLNSRKSVLLIMDTNYSNVHVVTRTTFRHNEKMIYDCASVSKIDETGARVDVPEVYKLLSAPILRQICQMYKVKSKKTLKHIKHLYATTELKVTLTERYPVKSAEMDGEDWPCQWVYEYTVPAMIIHNVNHISEHFTRAYYTCGTNPIIRAKLSSMVPVVKMPMRRLAPSPPPLFRPWQEGYASMEQKQAMLLMELKKTQEQLRRGAESEVVVVD